MRFEEFIGGLVLATCAIVLSLLIVSLLTMKSTDPRTAEYQGNADIQHIEWRLDKIESKLDRLVPTESK